MQTLDPGSTFGPYEVEGLIAGGGMGQVYAARHSVYGSVVALKVLKQDLNTDDAWRARLSEEGLVGTRLKHPHVLAARELVEHGDSVALVMDLVSGGQTLERVMSREFPQGLPLTDALRVFLGVLQGMDYAHEKGVVHGDIKPENVLVEGEFKTPSSWVPKVTDFGTVGLIAHPVVIDGRTAVVATPRYASPEHLLGVDQINPSSDVYCLGLLLHYLLTGQHASTARTVREAAERVRLPLPLVNLVDFPDSLITIVQHATMYDPRERYESCRSFALAVREVLDASGAGLDLEDLQADLATEVMEQRQREREEQRAATGLSKADPFGDTAETRLHTEDLPTEQAPLPDKLAPLDNAAPDQEEDHFAGEPSPTEEQNELGEAPLTEDAPLPSEDTPIGTSPPASTAGEVSPNAAAAERHVDQAPVADDAPIPIYVWIAVAVAGTIIALTLFQAVL